MDPKLSQSSNQALEARLNRWIAQHIETEPETEDEEWYEGRHRLLTAKVVVSEAPGNRDGRQVVADLTLHFSYSAEVGVMIGPIPDTS
jgi:predicted component of type VI protein secretion system